MPNHIKALRQHAARELAAHLSTDLTIDQADREASWLLEQITGLSPSQQHSRDISLSETQQQRFQALLHRRLVGEPLAYVLGTQPFWTFDLLVTPDVLIPRADTEIAVQRALAHLPTAQAAMVLDVGTGSGAIALAIALERPVANVLASDVSEAALQVATRNADRLGVTNVSFVQSDWFTAIAPQRVDVIVSNPPYIAINDPHLAAEVRAHEPTVALISGTDGLAAIRELIAGAPAFLQPGGWLVLEHGWQQAAVVQHLLESAGFDSVASHADLAGHLRVTEGRRR